MDNPPIDYRQQLYMKSKTPPPSYSTLQPNLQTSHNTGFDGYLEQQQHMSGQPSLSYNIQINQQPSYSPMQYPSKPFDNAGWVSSNPSDNLHLQQAPQIHQQLQHGNLSPLSYSPQVSVQQSYNHTTMSANLVNDPRLQWASNHSSQINDQQLLAHMQQQQQIIQINRNQPPLSYTSQPILQPSCSKPPLSTLSNGGNSGLQWASTTSSHSPQLQQQDPNFLRSQSITNLPSFSNSFQSVPQPLNGLGYMQTTPNASQSHHLQQIGPHILQPQSITNPPSLSFHSQPMLQPVMVTSAQANYFQQQTPYVQQQEFIINRSSTAKATPTKSSSSNLLIDFGFESESIPEPRNQPSEKPEPRQKTRCPSPISEKLEESLEEMDIKNNKRELNLLSLPGWLAKTAILTTAKTTKVVVKTAATTTKRVVSTAAKTTQEAASAVATVVEK